MKKEIREIFAHRLREARTRAMLSMEKLSDKTANAVSRQAIFKYENAEMIPDSTRLIKLCEALGENVDFFFRPFSFDINIEDISFRKSCIKGKKLDALKMEIQDVVERSIEIDDILGYENKKFKALTPPDKKRLRTECEMEECAKKVKREWNVDYTLPIYNTQLLLIQNGIDVIECDGHEKFDGVSLIANGKPIIVLNKNVTMTERRRFTSMHELGHLLFNDYFAEEIDDRQKEKMCHAFANEMLLPSITLSLLFKGKRNISLQELYKVQQIYGISVDAIMYKLRRLNIVTEKRYRTYCILKNNPVVREKIELSRYTEDPIQMFEAKVYRALAQNLITESKASHLLKEPLSEVRNEVNAI